MLNMRITPRRQRGFTLIEVLVALLIFAFGVLALVGLQVTAIRQSGNAKYRSDAAMLANQLIGQMWVTDRVTANLQTSFNTGGAQYNTWLTGVQSALPVVGIASAPTVSVSASGVVTINIYWKSPNEQSTDPQHSYVTVAQVR
jgi:type IV pilus assembly protein PilV